ncbi:Methionine ABC transporter ATP-binding protein [plant metagenome]|uniref:Methionine ABC transporter ATP-binding protein n=1 Tax=plant metagenome TaxID=1297885 RepID=A0A484NWR5_9ZZZZ
MIRIENLSKSFPARGGNGGPEGAFEALRGIDLDIGQGEVFGIIGRSGAGKSTLIRMLNLLERPSSGSVWIDGVDITRLDMPALRTLRQRIGMVFQHFNLLDSRTVLDNVCFPLRLAGLPRAERVARAKEVLALVGLSAHVAAYPRQLSGGQRQRVGIARALANRPTLLLCDEATSALDPETTQSILRLLADINQRLGLTIVLITHGMDVIRSVCDRVAVLDAGRVVESGEVLDVFLHPRHAVTQRLLAESGVQAEGWQALADATPGRIIRLSLRGDDTARPLLSRLSRELDVDLSILQGTVSRIKEAHYGQLVLAVDAGEATVARLLARLAEARIDHEVLR